MVYWKTLRKHFRNLKLSSRPKTMTSKLLATGPIQLQTRVLRMPLIFLTSFKQQIEIYKISRKPLSSRNLNFSPWNPQTINFKSMSGKFSQSRKINWSRRMLSDKRKCLNKRVRFTLFKRNWERPRTLSKLYKPNLIKLNSKLLGLKVKLTNCRQKMQN